MPAPAPIKSAIEPNDFPCRNQGRFSDYESPQIFQTSASLCPPRSSNKQRRFDRRDVCLRDHLSKTTGLVTFAQLRKYDI